MRVMGPDVSHFQSSVDWSKVAAHGEAFGACKATDGLRYVDPRFSHNWSGMKSAGIPVRIAYHYAHTESSATGQADHFLAVVGDVGPGDVLCLDAEDVCAESKRIPPKKTETWIGTFLDRVLSASGLPPDRILVYTGAWWWNSRTNNSTVGSAHPLWVADYSNDPPHLPAGWSDWVLHQYTDKDEVPGVPTHVDRSHFHGSVERLHALAGLTTPARPSSAGLPSLQNLGFGARNGDVRALQKRLVVMGFTVVVDGFYGPRTREAIAAFQLSRPELDGDPDGLVGPLTLRLLFA
jgi:GH25 family lysozyme M1 (1,4-beta-N-acetylmuramidase)